MHAVENALIPLLWVICCTYIQQQRARIITTQMEMSTTATTTATRMNSVRESARKKPPSVSPSVVLEPPADSESADEGPVVT